MERRIGFLSCVAIVLGLYSVSFIGYRWWAESTADSRPHGVPAWYFLYPTDTGTQRAFYRLFYPCIRLEQIAHDTGESPQCLVTFVTPKWRLPRFSEREPADSLRNTSNGVFGWLPSLTFALDLKNSLTVDGRWTDILANA
jgi:hypothetical protein